MSSEKLGGGHGPLGPPPGSYAPVRNDGVSALNLNNNDSFLSWQIQDFVSRYSHATREQNVSVNQCLANTSKDL